MEKIKTNKISMKPKWYFVLGSIFSLIGLIGLVIIAVFLTNLTFFLLKKHGPMGQWRLQQLIETFPLWIPIVALVSIVLGILFLKKYDFSYKKNFWLIAFAFFISIIFAGFAINQLGLNNYWSRRGPMRRFYQQFEQRNKNFPYNQWQKKGKRNFKFRF